MFQNRLCTVLPKSKYSIQSVFFLNHDIHDNILTTHEILNAFTEKHSKNGYMTIKLDIKKSSDMLELDFVKRWLTDLWFYER